MVAMSQARMAVVSVAVSSMLWLGACATSEIGPPAVPQAGLGCVDDSPQCITERGNTLRVLLADRSKSWVRAPASPDAYATGVRLWAFKQKKRDLNCDELGHARREADGAAPTLRGANGRLTPAQISRGIMLAQEVSRELGNEFGRRCRA